MGGKGGRGSVTVGGKLRQKIFKLIKYMEYIQLNKS